MSGESLHILLVDDDEVDVKATLEAFRDLRLANRVTVAHDGVEALEHLRGTDGREQIPRPRAILLDLNMPRMNGIEFIEEVRTDPELTDSLIFVLTTSKDDEDIDAAYRQHVAGYLLKEDVGRGFSDAIQTLEHYWRIIELPTERPKS